MAFWKWNITSKGLEAGKNQVHVGTRRSTILLTNRRLEGNLRTGTMFPEQFAQSLEALPSFSKQAVSHCDGGLGNEHPEGPGRRLLSHRKEQTQLRTQLQTRNAAWRWLEGCFQTYPPVMSRRISPNSRKSGLWNPGFIGQGLACLCILSLKRNIGVSITRILLFGKAHSSEEHLHNTAVSGRWHSAQFTPLNSAVRSCLDSAPPKNAQNWAVVGTALCLFFKCPRFL